MCVVITTMCTYNTALLDAYIDGSVHVYNLLSPEQLCAPQNVFNFTASDTLVTTSAVCLACLFNGSVPQPGTGWFLFGQTIGTFPFAQENDNGTLIFRPPQGFTGEAVLSCQHGGITFQIIVMGEYPLLFQC